MHQETVEEDEEEEMAKKKCGIARFVFSFVCFARILLRVFSVSVCLQTKIDINICVCCVFCWCESKLGIRNAWMEMLGRLSYRQNRTQNVEWLYI